MNLRIFVALLACLTAPTPALTAGQSDALVVQAFYDNLCTFQKNGDMASEYTFSAKYLANTLIATGISSKSSGKSDTLASLQDPHRRDGQPKPTSCFTEVRDVVRNGDQISAEVILQGLSADSKGVRQYAGRYGVVFVNTPPWQLLKSSELERWWLDANGTVLAHTLRPGTTSETPAPGRSWYVFPLTVGTQLGHLTLLIPPDIYDRQGHVKRLFSEYRFYDATSDSPLLQLAEGASSYDLKNFTKTCLNGKVAWTADGSDSGTVIMGEPGSWVSISWSGLSGDRLSKARAITSSMNVDFGPTC